MGVSGEINALTYRIIQCAIAVHRALGPGLLESTYFACLVMELRSVGLQVRTNVTVPVCYRGVNLDCGYKIDIIVNDTVILELKAVERVLAVHEAQLLTYLRLTGKPIGLLLNFNVAVLKDGITRKINT